MKKPILLVFLSLIVVTSCKDSALTKADVKSTSYYLNNTPMIANAAQQMRLTHSLADLANYMRTNYGIKDFSAMYNKVLPYLKGTKSVLHDKRISTSSDSTLLGLNDMLNSVGISKTSRSYKYAREVFSIFQNSESIATENVVAKVNLIKQSLENDNTVSDAEKNGLITISNMLIANYDGLLNIVSNTSSSSPSGRVSCWGCDVFNIILSVIVTVIAVALVVAAIVVAAPEVGVFLAGLLADGGAVVGVEVALTGLQAGFLVGAIAGAGYSIDLAAADDECYGASCGLDDEWGLKYCSTGDCVPN